MYIGENKDEEDYDVRGEEYDDFGRRRVSRRRHRRIERIPLFGLSV